MVTVKIYLHDGMQLTEEVETFDINEFVEKMNSHENGRMVLIGKVAISKENIRIIDTQNRELK